jgi:hypothetical protein
MNILPLGHASSSGIRMPRQTQIGTPVSSGMA